MPQLHFALVPAPDQVVVRLTGDADLSTAPILAGALTRAAGLHTRQVVVDLAGARFSDSSCLRTLADFTGELAADGRACRIVGALPPTRRLIRTADLAGDLVLDGALAADSSPGSEGLSGEARAPGPVSGQAVPAPRSQSLRLGVPRV